jgi:hypothetical protein
MSDWQGAVHCRNRAQVLRMIADETDNDDHQQSLRRVAVYYETLAAALDIEGKTRTPAPANETLKGKFGQ